LREHSRRWDERWTAGDIEIEGDASAQLALRFAIYHMIGGANPEDERVSIAARGLTGDAYAGHVFWDTEIFLLPFYTLTWPAAARALLMYRYHTLPAARAKAAAFGHRGAFYPWESADGGREATPRYVRGRNHEAILIGNAAQEQHISADIAYAVWQYWQATGDDAFLLEAGAEIILETARFWASRAEPGTDGRFHLRGVIGPDEYHDAVDDNAYTNGMAQWNLECAIATAQCLRDQWPERWQELRDRLALTEEEEELWRRVGEGLGIPWGPDTGVIEQFAGFFDLEPIPIPSDGGRRVPMDVLLGPARTRASQVAKQADTLMLLALLPDRFPRAVQAANFQYYEARCGHGSSLSPAIHALVAARLGEMEAAERYFREAAGIDLEDGMGNASEGVHMAALGGLWQAVVFGFAGVSLRPEGLELAPRLPASWQSLRFRVQWHGRQVAVHLDGQARAASATLERGEPMTVRVGPGEHRLTPGESWTCPWGDDEPREPEGSIG
jgi:trehalose/maltose hydrolase-like predicted phosphorylase